jgi:integrase
MEVVMNANQPSTRSRTPWNKDKLVGPKAPFKPKDVWTMRMQLQQHHRTRELALLVPLLRGAPKLMAVTLLRKLQDDHPGRFPDGMLRGCDLVALRVRDIAHGEQIAPRAIIQQRKTGRPVQFEITPVTRQAVQEWIRQAGLGSDDYLFPSRLHGSPHVGTRQYARMLRGWAKDAGLDWTEYGTHSIRRTKATLIYRRTKNLRAVQLLLGHSRIESTVRYLGIDVDDALEISEQTEI